MLDCDGFVDGVSGVFHEMRPVYPMMGLFEARLAVGCLDGLINIYDLKSATRWQAIPAHSTPVTSISFSHDGRMLASFSIFEKMVRVWHVSLGGTGHMRHLAAAVLRD